MKLFPIISILSLSFLAFACDDNKSDDSSQYTPEQAKEIINNYCNQLINCGSNESLENCIKEEEEDYNTNNAGLLKTCGYGDVQLNFLECWSKQTCATIESEEAEKTCSITDEREDEMEACLIDNIDKTYDAAIKNYCNQYVKLCKPEDNNKLADCIDKFQGKYIDATADTEETECGFMDAHLEYFSCTEKYSSCEAFGEDACADGDKYSKYEQCIK